MIVTINAVSPNTLPHDFSPLIIEHSFVCNFLKSSPGIFIHLVPLNDPVTAMADSAFCFGRIFLLYRSSIEHFSRAHKRFLLEPLARSVCKRPEINWLHNFFPHFTHHLVHLLETASFLEEWIIFEDIAAKAYKDYWNKAYQNAT